MHTGTGWRRWVGFAAALLLLNLSLTFRNIWPTPAITWHGDLSIELTLCVLGLLIAARWLGPPSRTALRALAVVWMLFVIGHYADVTAPALYGRDVNLYWDLQHVSNVASMLAVAAPVWLVLLVVVVSVVILAALYALGRWAVGRLGEALRSHEERLALAVLTTMSLVLFVGQQFRPDVDWPPGFSTPVTATYMRQTRLMLQARAAHINGPTIAPAVSLDSNLALAGGADVLLLFHESYGAVSYDRPEFASRLAASRAELEDAIHDTNRHVVSAFVESPTFGGSSWLAHISLLSGIDVRDPDTNALLMTEKRETMVTAFARRGYRTIALMPGMWQAWPEGAFYGFDDIYGGARLAYQGPAFGWWDIPDQFAMAQLDALEMNRVPRAPLFVFFPTVSTHAPFTPTPPYQPNWPRMLTAQPYDVVDVERAFAEEADWMNLGPSYANAVSYTDEVFSGYLRQHPDTDFIMIVIGDHQPPAAVTGEGAPWDVPVHVIASRRAVLDRLRARGFQDGLTPQRPAIGRMHALLAILLEAFHDEEALAAG